VLPGGVERRSGGPPGAGFGPIAPIPLRAGASVQIDVAGRLGDGLVLGTLEGVLELSVQQILLGLLGLHRFFELGLPLRRLCVQAFQGLAQILDRSLFRRRLVREDAAEPRVDTKLRLAAGTHHLEWLRRSAFHGCLRPLARSIGHGPSVF